MPNSWQTSCTTLASRLVSWSKSRDSGTPYIGNTSSTKSLAIRLAFSGAGKIRCHLAKKSCLTITYLFPLAVLGLHYVYAPYLKWPCYWYRMERWPLLPSHSCRNSTLSTIPTKSNGISIYIFPTTNCNTLWHTIDYQISDRPFFLHGIRVVV